MRKISDILKGQSGASLPMALLLFLVCSLLASALLAAGTAAVGQHSNKAAANQRYYSVMSAAKMFSDTLDGQVVTVTVEKSYDVTTTVSFDEEGASSSDQSESNVSYSLTIDGKDFGDEATEYTLLEGTVNELVGLEYAEASALWGSDFDFEPEVSSTRLSVEHSLDEVPDSYRAIDLEEALAVDVMERISADGAVNFTFENASTGNVEYEAVVGMDYETQIFSETDEGQPQITQTDSQRIETKHVVDKKSLVVTWHSMGISKAGA